MRTVVVRVASLRGRSGSMTGYREHPNRKCISGSDGSLIPARSGNHTELWLLSVAKLIAKVRTFAADFCSKESPAEPMTGKPLQNLRVLQWLAELHFLFGCSPRPDSRLTRHPDCLTDGVHLTNAASPTPSCSVSSKNSG